MKVSKLLKNYVNYDDGKHDRRVGRYWSSEIYRMRKGYFKPEDFFKDEKIGLTGARNIITGIASESMLENILDTLEIEHDYNPKKVIKINDEIEIVVKPDFVFDKFSLETKHPTRDVNEIPDWYKDQLECTRQAFEKDTYLGVFSNPFGLDLHYYWGSDERWKEIIEIVKKFHEKLKKTS